MASSPVLMIVRSKDVLSSQELALWMISVTSSRSRYVRSARQLLGLRSLGKTVSLTLEDLGRSFGCISAEQKSESPNAGCLFDGS